MILQGKKVLVTGSEGFIGSHLVERLLSEGCSVRAMILYNSLNSWGWLESLSESLPKELLSNIEIYPSDIRDVDAVSKACEGIDLIFHLAALIAIPYSYQSPRSYVDTNIVGTLYISPTPPLKGILKYI
ncbi:MAG: GDP-mannose 4,6-dehydratase [Oligoflexia bacterium]|nr:GDP-mannose 4,6-dehydratase [Oligoflexia bacterium]